MSDQDNDRLEQFFRKAASQPDVPFNEEDWKRLEARLDGHDALTGGVPKGGSKIISVVVVAVILIFTAGLVINDHYHLMPSMQSATNGDLAIENDQARLPNELASGGDMLSNGDERGTTNGKRSDLSETPEVLPLPDEASRERDIQSSPGVAPPSTDDDGHAGAEDAEDTNLRKNEGTTLVDMGIVRTNSSGVVGIDDEQIIRDFMHRAPVLAIRNKQRAIVELPGAEEVETGEAESVVRKEQVSDQSDRATTPRLSLLLSFAPDFSGTSLSQYSAPGKAFGALLHYHIGSRWSASVGVIKNNKQYTGKGEDYQPPEGYWKYYTNGKVPNSIFGACDVLEFPIMVQYTLLNNGKNKLLAGAGTSSYLMLSESYQYRFDEPNPGARERWDSRSTSRFLMNMVNLTVGYERQVLPGFMIGVEPYVKIPVEKIGWCNLKLYSTGAAITMRYTILRKKIAVTNPSRGPD